MSPVDQKGRPRQNDVAFTDDDDPTNKTVTRGHGHIKYLQATRRYHAFDEGSANGTRVVRAGAVIDVPALDPQGVALANGDELQLGSASLRVGLAR